MHDGAVGLDGPAHDTVAILEIDNDDFRLRVVVKLLSDADVVVGFEGAAVKANGSRLALVSRAVGDARIGRTLPGFPPSSTASSP